MGAFEHFKAKLAIGTCNITIITLIKSSSWKKIVDTMLSFLINKIIKKFLSTVYDSKMLMPVQKKYVTELPGVKH